MVLKRDILGEMRDGMNPGLLTSQNFETVDRDLWAAFLHHSKTSPVSPYCAGMMHEARVTEDLAVKKMFVMTLMCIHPGIRSYYENNCPADKFNPWIDDLKKNISNFTRGLHRDGVSKCVFLTDATYPSVVAFVAEMTSYYVNL